MLIRFSVSNFYSFKETTDFNMLPGNVRRLSNHVYKPTAELETLKVAAIYGPNGAGKSNLVKAMWYMQTMIAEGWLSPSNNKFQLDPSCLEQPSSFELEFVLKGSMYVYGFDVQNFEISEEWLYQTFTKKEDELIFHRYTNGEKNRLILAENFIKTAEDKLRLQLYEQEMLKPKMLLIKFLSEAKFDFGVVRTAFEYLSQKWIFIFPQTTKGLVQNLVSEEAFYAFAQSLIASLQTGITRLEIETKDLSMLLPEDIAAKEKLAFEEAERNGKQVISKADGLGNELLIQRIAGQIVGRRLLFWHEGAADGARPFVFAQESDGTKRLLELLVAFYRAIKTDAIVVVDELERAIHPVLCAALVSKFAEDKQTLGQLIFTTHEAELLDQNYMRSDEFWFVEKGQNGESKLTPMSDYKDVRFDLDLHKGYLNGRFGAVPFTGDIRKLQWNKNAQAQH